MTTLRNLAGLAVLALWTTVALAEEPADPADPADEAPAAEAPADEAPADEAPPQATAEGDEEALMPEEREALHLPAAELAKWAPKHDGLAKVIALYTDLVDDAVTGDRDADVALMTEVKPPEMDALHEAAMAVVGEGGKQALAAAFVLANASLYYADLGYSIVPGEQMTESQKKKFTKQIEREIRPLLAPVDAEARQYLQSVADAAADDSAWDARAKTLIARLDAAGR